ncbi:MAG TPA: hypothetical protein VGE12_02295 [Noviherbaspirillum sp.]
MQRLVNLLNTAGGTGTATYSMETAAMRLVILAASLFASALPAIAQNNDFSGAWVAWLCPNGVSRDSGKCSNFVLELHQKEGRLCGAHFFATAGASRVDEGAAPSITGEIADDTASVVTISSRAMPPVRVRAEMKMVNGALQWKRLENPSGDYLLPLSTRLTRSRSKTLFAPVFEHELRAACLSVFTTAEESAKAAAPEGKPEEAPAKP